MLSCASPLVVVVVAPSSLARCGCARSLIALLRGLGSGSLQKRKQWWLWNCSGLWGVSGLWLWVWRWAPLVFGFSLSIFFS